MAEKDMVIFTRTFDFLTWLLPVTNHFPKAQRHTFTRRLLDAGGGHEGGSRLVLSRDDIVELVRVFLPDSSNDARLIDRIDTDINKIVPEPTASTEFNSDTRNIS